MRSIHPPLYPLCLKCLSILVTCKIHAKRRKHLITLLLPCFDDDDQKQSVESILLRRVENVAQHAQRAFETDETFTSREAIGCVVVERRRPRNDLTEEEERSDEEDDSFDDDRRKRGTKRRREGEQIGREEEEEEYARRRRLRTNQNFCFL